MLIKHLYNDGIEIYCLHTALHTNRNIVNRIGFGNQIASDLFKLNTKQYNFVSIQTNFFTQIISYE